MTRRGEPQFWRTGLLCCAVMAIASCSGWRHGATEREFEGQMLRVKNNGPGAPRLAIESDYDSTVRHFVQQNDEPDYIYVADRFNVQLVYVGDDRIVLFQREWWKPESQATVTDGIPEGLVKLLTRADQDRLAQTRAQRPRSSPTSKQ